MSEHRDGGASDGWLLWLRAGFAEGGDQYLLIPRRYTLLTHGLSGESEGAIALSGVCSGGVPPAPSGKWAPEGCSHPVVRLLTCGVCASRIW